jgi:hypothetical protein
LRHQEEGELQEREKGEEEDVRKRASLAVAELEVEVLRLANGERLLVARLGERREQVSRDSARFGV